MKTTLKLLAVASVLVVLTGALWNTTRQTRMETCVQCRLDATVEMVAGMETERRLHSNTCSVWYAQNLGTHEHVWRQTGCTYTRSVFGTTLSFPAGQSPLKWVTAPEQASALIAFTDEQREQFFALAASGDHAAQEQAAQLVRRVVPR